MPDRNRRFIDGWTRRQSKSEPPAIEQLEAEAPEIDLRRDLWKYALWVMVQRPNMEISTTDLINELPNCIAVPADAEVPKTSPVCGPFWRWELTLLRDMAAAYLDGLKRGEDPMAKPPMEGA